MSLNQLNPLRDSHEAAGAEMQAYGAVEIVSTFNEPQAEYAAIHKGCGLMDLPQRGIVEVTGADRLKFLNNLLTNELIDRETKTPLQPGQGVYAFLLNNKTGRIILDLNLLEVDGDRTIIELDARLIPLFFETLDKYRFSENVKWESKCGELHEIALHGASALEIAGHAGKSTPNPLTSDAPGLATSMALSPTSQIKGRVPFNTAEIKGTRPFISALSVSTARMLDHDVIVWRDDPCGVPGLHLIVPNAHVAAIWNDLLTRFGAVNDVQYARKSIRPIGWAAFNTARIEAGRAIFGIDFDETMLPLEISLAPRGVSFTKGCYPGQEIVARMHARQQVAKQIVGLRMDDDALPVAGTIIYDDANNQIGGITSSTVSPVLSNACIALGILKKPHFAIGTSVKIPAEGQLRKAKVVELPFVQR